MSEITILVIEDGPAVLRRTCERTAPADSRAIPGGNVDFKERALTFDDGRREELSERESDLLRCLLDSQGRIISREEILRNFWGGDPDHTETPTIEMQIMHLRNKLGDKDQFLLVTVRGKGYQWTPRKPPAAS